MFIKIDLNRLFITFFYSGLFPKAPGTAGSFLALIFGILILNFFPIETLFMLTILITIIGIFEINRYEKKTDTHDDKSIVIDEVSGMWITLIITYSVSIEMSFNFANMIGYILAFVTFRFFDIWKPSTIGKIDREVKGGLGVMGDDILAGIAGGFLSILILLSLEKILYLI